MGIEYIIVIPRKPADPVSVRGVDIISRSKCDPVAPGVKEVLYNHVAIPKASRKDSNAVHHRTFRCLGNTTFRRVKFADPASLILRRSRAHAPTARHP